MVALEADGIGTGQRGEQACMGTRKARLSPGLSLDKGSSGKSEGEMAEPFIHSSLVEH